MLPEDRIAAAGDTLDALQRAIETRVLGQSTLVSHTILGVLARGHVLIDGRPGLGKTLLARVLAQAAGLQFARVPCTPDLSPSDVAHSAWSRAHIVLVDEIHRAPPKTQAMWIEGMHDHAIAVDGQHTDLPDPQTIIATQVPIDRPDTFPLAEAQLDRFLFALEVPYPSLDNLKAIGLRHSGPPEPAVPPVLDRAMVVELQALARQLIITPPVADYAARLTLATHPDHPQAIRSVRQFVRFGASPRAMQGLLVAGRAHALRRGRAWVTEEDLRVVALPVLRHRIVLTFEAQLEGMTPASLITEILDALPGLAST